MRSKTILATALVGALAAPVAALADDNSSYNKSPSASASVGGASVQGSLGSSDRSAGAYGQDRNDRYAQNDDHDNGKHRGRDKHRDKDKDHKDRQASNQQYGSSSGQYSQNQKQNPQYSQNQQYPSSSASSGQNDRYAQSNQNQNQYPSQSNQQYSANSRY